VPLHVEQALAIEVVSAQPGTGHISTVGSPGLRHKT
jgi:hypothetical protein